MITIKDYSSGNPVTKKISRPVSVAKVKPEPIENYTVTYERIVLNDDFELSKLDPDSTLEIWLTNPPLPKPNVAANVETVELVGNFSLRDLSSNTTDSNIFTSSNVFESTPYFATAAKMGMEATGPQEELMYEKKSNWTPKLLKHTNFSVVQKELKITTTPPYVGSTVTIPLNPRELGDLMSNMYFTCKLPPTVKYTPRVGRALFKKVELCFNEFVIQRYDDNWATIHDELFLSADESLVLDQILNGTNLIIPLKFFFCEMDQYLPLCALYNQTIYIKLYFNEQSWFTDYPYPMDIIEPALLFDQIFLTDEERNFYKLNSHELVIPTVENETPQLFNRGIVTLNMSSNFNVSVINWFIRNEEYEKRTADYNLRYSYGYVSPLVNSYTNFVNWKGETVNYVQVIDYIDIFINNVNIIKGLTGDLYFTYHQPTEHGLSAPDKTIYTYCFGEDPKNPIKRGEIDFRQIQVKNAKLTIKFLESFVPQLSQNYYLHLYYYGYKTLLIDKGFGVLRT